MKIHKNQSGFSHVEILLIIIIVTLISVVGWFVYDRNNKGSSNNTPATKQITNFDECAEAGNPIMESYPEQCAANGKTFTKDVSKDKAPESTNTNQTFKGTFYETPAKEYSVRLAEGWKLSRYMKDSGLATFNNDDLKVMPGVRAEVTEIDAARDGIGGLFISWRGSLDYEPNGQKTIPFKTDDGLDVIKYSYTETKDPEGIGLQKGGQSATYIVKKNEKSLVHIYYGFYPPEQTDYQATIEQVIRTIVINK